MSNDQIVLPKDADITQANAAHEVAVNLRKYLKTSGDLTVEADLIKLLNERPSLLQRMFPTEGQRIIKQIAAEDLRQLRRNKTELVQLHHKFLLDSATSKASHMLQMQGMTDLAEKSEFVLRSIAQTYSNIRGSQRAVNIELEKQEREAHVRFADNKKYLDREITQIDKMLDAHMLATERLLDETTEMLQRKGISS